MNYDLIVDQVFSAMEKLGINYMPTEEQLADIYGPLFICILDGFGGLEYMKDNYNLYSQSEYIAAVIRGSKKIADAIELRHRKELREMLNEHGVIKLRNMIYQEDSRMSIEQLGLYDVEVI